MQYTTVTENSSVQTASFFNKDSTVRSLTAQELEQVQKLDQQTDENQINTGGNSPENISNRDLCQVAKQGGWIYYMSYYAGRSPDALYKSRPDGSERTL